MKTIYLVALAIAVSAITIFVSLMPLLNTYKGGGGIGAISPDIENKTRLEQLTFHDGVSNPVIGPQELDRIHTLCNDPIISTSGYDTIITCPIPANVTSWIDISPPVYKRTVCTSAYGCSGEYVYIQQNKESMISEKQKQELENFVLKDIPEAKSWQAGWTLDHVEIHVQPSGVYAYLQFFIPVINPTYKYCGWYPQIGVDLERKEIFEKDNLIPKSTTLCSNANSSNNPLGVTALVKYTPYDACIGMSCPPYTFYLKVNSNSTAYLLGYDICGSDLCVKNNTLSILLPINNMQIPNYTYIGLSDNKKWNYGDTVDMKLEISPTLDNKTAYFLDIKNSTIVP